MLIALKISSLVNALWSVIFTSNLELNVSLAQRAPPVFRQPVSRQHHVKLGEFAQGMQRDSFKLVMVYQENSFLRRRYHGLLDAHDLLILNIGARALHCGGGKKQRVNA